MPHRQDEHDLKIRHDREVLRYIYVRQKADPMMTVTRKPTSIGEMLTEEFLEPMNISRTRLAHECGVPLHVIDAIARDEVQVSVALARSLSRALGTSPEFWLNLQTRNRLWQA
jgi:antitoxin HigA-1